MSEETTARHFPNPTTATKTYMSSKLKNMEPHQTQLLTTSGREEPWKELQTRGSYTQNRPGWLQSHQQYQLQVRAASVN